MDLKKNLSPVYYRTSKQYPHYMLNGINQIFTTKYLDKYPLKALQRAFSGDNLQ